MSANLIKYDTILRAKCYVALNIVSTARVKAMPTLPNHPKIQNFQQYVAEMELERGFNDQTVLQKCLLLGEEVGELFKAIRKNSNMKLDLNSKVGSVDEELADILIYLCAIANKLDVDLETAFRDKEQANKSRTWTTNSPEPSIFAVRQVISMESLRARRLKREEKTDLNYSQLSLELADNADVVSVLEVG
jgi:NTP pyrophosphatase (non-canonical NTP hydrolase)